MLALLVTQLLLAAPPRSASESDPALLALSDELSRYATLKSGTLERPYFLSGTLTDSDQIEIGASFGALVVDHREGHRLVHVVVRVGTPELDNTNSAEVGFMPEFMMGPHGGAAWDADYDAFRNDLWLELDGQYKKSLEALARKKAYLETHAVTDRPPDFGPAAVKEVVLPRVTLSIDEARWRDLARKVSATFRPGDNVTSGTVELRADALNDCFASTDPVRDRFGDTHLTLTMNASAIAPDGMEVRAQYQAAGRVDVDLPSEASLLKTARELADRLQKLAKAPLLSEDYSGPVLFTGRAAAIFFLKGLGEPLGHPRDALEGPRAGRLTERLGKHVAPPMLGLRDDSTLKSWKGTPLLGWFPVDDDGVVPVPITLVDKGVLKTFPMSRTPTGKVSASNGHARAGQGGIGNLFVGTQKPESRAALKRKLIQLAKENDQDYGLLVDDFLEPESGLRQEMLEMFATLRGGGRVGGDITLPPPAIVYRVFPNGREELVRGASFKSISFQALKDIVGMGDSSTVLNTTSQGQPVSVVAPAVLVKQLELKKPTEEFDKPSAIPRPVVSVK